MASNERPVSEKSGKDGGEEPFVQVRVENCTALGDHCDSGVSTASSYYTVPPAIAIGKYIVTFSCLALS